MSTKQTKAGNQGSRADEQRDETADGRSENLRDSPMMAHLLDALEAGRDIGHFGRLTFAMIGRHFLAEEALVSLLAKQPDHGETDARVLVRQVEAKEYSPPKRERILEWQAQQKFQIIPNPDDPDSGNVYRDLTFPDGVYEDIEEYHEQKAEAKA